MPAKSDSKLPGINELLMRFMRRDLDYRNQPANIVMRMPNRVLVKPEAVPSEFK
jgi:hypothetical protein